MTPIKLSENIFWVGAVEVSDVPVDGSNPENVF